MACIGCEKFRNAILEGRMADAMGIGLDVFRAKFGPGEPEPKVIAGEPVSKPAKPK